MLCVGMFGCGVVGSGVLEVLGKRGDFEVRRILVRDLEKARPAAPGPIEWTTDPRSILDDPKIDIVIECMGGTGMATEVALEALRKGKHLISANKASISRSLFEYEQITKQMPNSAFLFEAAICGGVPIVNVIRRSLICDQILTIKGILNGTTNFMLTAMDKNGIHYHQALKEAQRLGYAEADPSADVLGWDARSKLCILAKLAFGVTIEEQSVFAQGIDRVTQDDFEYARMMKHTIKLIGKCRKNPDGSVYLWISPALVPSNTVLGATEDVANAVTLVSQNLGPTTYLGPGAGSHPTANSIVSDLFEIRSRVQNVPTAKFPPAFPEECTASGIALGFNAKFYIRFIVKDILGVVEKISSLFTKFGVSIFSILQTEITDRDRVPFVIVTDESSSINVRELLEAVDTARGCEMSFVLERPMLMIYLTD